MVRKLILKFIYWIFINYFKYDVATPAENELFGVHTEMIRCPWNAETMLYRLTLQAEKAENMKMTIMKNMSDEIRRPLNVISGFAQVIGNPEFQMSDAVRADVAGIVFYDCYVH